MSDLKEDGESEVRADDWKNAVGGLGSSRDKHVGLTFTRRDRLSRETLEALYEQNPIVARVVDRIVDDGLRTGWDLTNVKDAEGNEIKINPDTLRSWLSDLRVDEVLRKAGKWSRLYGGALILLPVLDGKQPDQAAEIGKPLLPISVVSADHAQPLEQDVGIFSSTHGKVLQWQVRGVASDTVNVHHSRTIPMEAVKLPVDTLRRSPTTGSLNGWGPSVVERIYDDLGRDGAAASHAVAMMYNASVLWMQVKNYRVDRSAKGGRERMQERASDMRLALDSFGLLMMDADDKIGNSSPQVTGAFELIDRMRSRLAGATEYPEEILFNKAANGLRGGELSGAQEIYFQRVDHWRNEEATPVLDTILRFVFAWKGIKAASWCVEWRPLWTKSDEVTADTHLKNAQADQIYHTIGALGEDEIRSTRFELGVAGAIEVDGPLPEEPLPAPGVGGPAAGVEGDGPELDLPEPNDAITIQGAAERLGVHTATISALLRRRDPVTGEPVLRYWGAGSKKVISLRALAGVLRGHEAVAKENENVQVE